MYTSISLRAGGKKKAKYRTFRGVPIIRKGSPRRSTTRSSSRRSNSAEWISPVPVNNNRPINIVNISTLKPPSSRSKSSKTISINKAFLILSALVHTISAQGSYTAPTEFFLNKVAGCTSHTSSCFNRVETATLNKFPSMTGKQKMELSWAKENVKYSHFRDREFPGRKPKPSGGAKVSTIVNSLKWLGIVGVSAGTIKWILSRPAVGSRSGVMLPQITYSQHGPWKQ